MICFLLERQMIDIFKHDKYTRETTSSSGIFPTQINTEREEREKKFARDVQRHYYVVRFLCSDHTKHKS